MKYQVEYQEPLCEVTEIQLESLIAASGFGPAPTPGDFPDEFDDVVNW